MEKFSFIADKLEGKGQNVAVCCFAERRALQRILDSRIRRVWVFLRVQVPARVDDDWSSDER